ncbi:MAG: BPSS1780 family membrane protein [Panacagrimonas sp.]
MTSQPIAKSVPIGRGLGWMTDAWPYFAKSPGTWVLITLILGILSIGVSLIPGGQILISLLTPVLSAGLLAGCAAQQSGERISVTQLFAAFSHPRLGRLMLLGLLALLGYAVCLILFVIGLYLFIGGAALSLHQGLPPELGIFGIVLVVLIGMASMVPVMMASWFAPALVVFRDLSATQALLQSFFACLRNVFPFLIYGLVLFVLFFVATIPLGLGLLIVFPMVVASVYVAYRDIFSTDGDKG